MKLLSAVFMVVALQVCTAFGSEDNRAVETDGNNQGDLFTSEQMRQLSTLTSVLTKLSSKFSQVRRQRNNGSVTTPAPYSTGSSYETTDWDLDMAGHGHHSHHHQGHNGHNHDNNHHQGHDHHGHNHDNNDDHGHDSHSHDHNSHDHHQGHSDNHHGHDAHDHQRNGNRHNHHGDNHHGNMHHEHAHHQHPVADRHNSSRSCSKEDGFLKFNNTCYFIGIVGGGREKGRHACHELGGYLVEVSNYVEHQFLHKAIRVVHEKGYRNMYHTGGIYSANQEEWVWQHSGQPMTFSDWSDRAEPERLWTRPNDDDDDDNDDDEERERYLIYGHANHGIGWYETNLNVGGFICEMPL